MFTGSVVRFQRNFRLPRTPTPAGAERLIGAFELSMNVSFHGSFSVM
jgi:hypothetical protein